jgi:F-box/leucine-rich repeat protein 10/11
VSDEDSSSNKRIRHASSLEAEFMNGDMHARHSLPNQFSVGSSLLQDIAFSAQQALARDEDDLVPVDPALQAYASGAYSAMDMTPSYGTNGEGILSSIEQQAEGDAAMDSAEFETQNGGVHGPSVEALTPGPPPHNDTVQAQTNGFARMNGFQASDSIHAKTNGFGSHNNAVRRPSSPVSPRQMSAVSPSTNNYNTHVTSPATNQYNNFTTDSDFPPPITPAANSHRASRPPNSSSHKASQTPSRRRASKTPKSTPSGKRHDSRGRDGIKLEAGFGMGGMNMGMGMNMNMNMMAMDMIDPSLDQASIDLIKQLQAEDLGLRRRSR